MKNIKTYNIVMTILLIMSGGAILHNLNSFILSTVSYILLLFGLLFNVKVINKKELFFLLSAFMYFFIYLFLNFFLASFPNNIFEYITFFLKVSYLFLLIFYYYKTNLNIKDDIYKILKLLMILSLIGTFLANFFPFLFKPIYSSTIPCKTFLYLFYCESSFVFKGFTIYRNQGIFWEPGAFQVFLNVLLFILLSEKKDKKLIFLTIISIISTYSTTGLFILVIQLIYFYFKNARITVSQLFFRLPILIVIVIIPLFIVIKGNIVQKVNGEHKLSSTLRTYDTNICFNLIKEHPISGIGLNKENYIDLQMKYDEYFLLKQSGLSYIVDERGNTNSFLYYIVMFGIPLFIVFFYFLRNQQVIIYNRNIFIFILIVSSLSEPQITTTFFMLFPTSGLFFKLFKNKPEFKYPQVIS